MEQIEHNLQETTSVYFNNIIRRDVSPITVDELDPSALEGFNRNMAITFPEDDEVLERVRYLAPYILQNIDWEEYGLPLEAWQLRYYYQRDRFLEKTGLSCKNFRGH